MHQEQPRVGQVEWAAQCRDVDVVHVAGEDLHVVESERRDDRSRPLYRRLAKVDTDDLPTGPNQFRQDSKCANRSATALEHVPALLDTNSPERPACHVPENLGNAEAIAGGRRPRYPGCND